MNTLRKIRQSLKNFFIAVALSIAVVLVVSIFWISLQLNPRREAELIATLLITMGAIIVAASVTALIHALINRVLGQPVTAFETGLVFRESIKRYAWIAAPIASGYGIAQIVRTVAEITVQAP